MGADRKHCWHTSGHGLSHGMGGSEVYRCCWCAMLFTRYCSDRQQRSVGHGPHQSETVREWSQLPTDGCAGRAP